MIATGSIFSTSNKITRPQYLFPVATGKNSPSLHARRIRKSRHVGRQSQSPYAAIEASAFLRLHPVVKPGMLLRFRRQVYLRPRPIQRLTLGQFAIDALGGRDRFLRQQRLLDLFVIQ